MLEVMLCSLLTVVPDYLFRRYWQGKRVGKEITFYSVWFELRWGITSCLILTVSLITVIFYNHPSTTNVTLFFRTVPIISETTGRVAEVFVPLGGGPIEKGAPIFRLDNSKQEAAVESARRKIAEVDAELVVARSDIAKAEGQLQEANSTYQQIIDEITTKEELQRRSPGSVPFREIERLKVRAQGQLGAIAAATATKQGLEERVNSLLPAQKASAEAALAEAEVDLAKTVIRAGVSGRLEQFTLRVGDIVTSDHALGRGADPRGGRPASPLRRLRTNRGTDHESGNDRRGHLRIEAFHRYPHGRHQRAGLHCGRSVSRR